MCEVAVEADLGHARGRAHPSGLAEVPLGTQRGREPVGDGPLDLEARVRRYALHDRTRRDGGDLHPGEPAAQRRIEPLRGEQLGQGLRNGRTAAHDAGAGVVVGASIAPPLVAAWIPAGVPTSAPLIGLPFLGKSTNLPSFTWRK